MTVDDSEQKHGTAPRSVVWCSAVPSGGIRNFPDANEKEKRTKVSRKVINTKVGKFVYWNIHQLFNVCFVMTHIFLTPFFSEFFNLVFMRLKHFELVFPTIM